MSKADAEMCPWCQLPLKGDECCCGWERGDPDIPTIEQMVALVAEFEKGDAQ